MKSTEKKIKNDNRCSCKPPQPQSAGADDRGSLHDFVLGKLFEHRPGVRSKHLFLKERGKTFLSLCLINLLQNNKGQASYLKALLGKGQMILG